MGFGYEVARFFMTSALQLFFANGVEVVGQEHVPKDGPVIFVCGPHSNQFIDSLSVLKAVGGSSGRSIVPCCAKKNGAKRSPGFVIAEVSYKKLIVGSFAKLLNSVPVTRPQDRATVGTGTITSIDTAACVLIGNNTEFSKQGQVGYSIGIKGVGTFVIKEIVDDGKIIFKPLPDDMDVSSFTSNAKYKVIPKLNQDKVFDAVYKRLLKNGSIAIFPEGGSHDQTEMLPLKAGVTMMALGAASRGAPVKLVALGINYFNAHVFRSNAFVEVSQPMEIPPKLLEQYKAGETKQACDALLHDIRELLKSVTMHAPSYEILKTVRTARRMYQNGLKLSRADYVRLTNRFVRGNEIWLEKKDPEYNTLLNDIHGYLKECWAQGLTDKQVRDLPPLGKFTTVMWALFEVLQTLFFFVIMVPLALPGLILNAPIIARINCIVRREMKKALANSSVKIAARDVAASQKLINGAVLSTVGMIIYTSVTMLLLHLFLRKEIVDGTPLEAVLFEHGWWIFPLLFLVLFPVYVFLFVVRVGESSGRRLRDLKVHLKTISSLCRSNKKNPAELLRQDRKRLVLRVQNFVEAQVSSFPEWEMDRVISKSQISNRRSDGTLKLLESGDLSPKIKSNVSLELSNSPDSP